MSSACAALSRFAQLDQRPPQPGYTTDIRLQCSISHQLLPKNEQTKPDEVRLSTTYPCFPMANCLHVHQDIPYLSPIIKEIEAERRERMDLDAMVIKK